MEILKAIAEDQGFKYDVQVLGWTHPSQHARLVRQMV